MGGYFQCSTPNAGGGVLCDQDQRGPCDLDGRSSCSAMPSAWGTYCAYEISFIQKRYNDLNQVFKALHQGLSAEGIDGFQLNHTTLWEVCFVYANDLKPIRQFHDIDQGCDKNRRAALIARLISNFRPIFISEFVIPDNKEKQGHAILRINEIFALQAFLHFLDVPPKICSIPGFDKIQSDLLFIFSYRDPQPESLVCIARCIETFSKHIMSLPSS